MGLFDFFKKTAKSKPIDEPITESNFTPNPANNSFEFLITGDIELPTEGWEEILTPNSMDWIKIEKNKWTYFKVGEDEFSYSWEPPGIQMTFNDSMPFDKAKKIADEVIENIRALGQNAELVILNANTLYKF